MPEIESRIGANTIDQVLSDFDSRKEHFSDLSITTERLVKILLREARIPFQSVQARVKKRDKVKSKYCSPFKDYKSLDEMPDLVGLRIITYYSDKIDQIAEVIGREFTQCGPIEDKRLGKLESFGYSAIHMDCMHSPARLVNTEYKRFTNARFEVQITTILGHAWAEMHHPWYDEFNSPSEELRRFHRLAAVLELAEQEFLEIRRKREDRQKIAAVRIESNAPNTPITLETLEAFVDRSDWLTEIDRQIHAINGSTVPIKANKQRLALTESMLKAGGCFTIQQLESWLIKGQDAIIMYVQQAEGVRKDKATAKMNVAVQGVSLLMLGTILIESKGAGPYLSFEKEVGAHRSELFDLPSLIEFAREAATKIETA